MRFAWLLVAVACGSEPAGIDHGAHHQPSPAGVSGPALSVAAAPHPGATPSAPAPAQPTAPTPLDLRVQAMGRQAIAELDRCVAVVTPLTGWTPEQGAITLSADALIAACGGLERVWRTHKDELIGKTYAANRTLGGLSRVGEDVRVLALVVRSGRVDGAYASAVDHIRRSVVEERRAFEEGMLRAEGREIGADLRADMPLPELRELILRRLDAHSRELAMVMQAHRNYAWMQVGNRDLYRTMMVEHFVRALRAVADADRAAVAAVKTPGATAYQAAWKPYDEALEALLQAGERGAEPYLRGDFPIPDAKARYDAVEAADARWKSALEVCRSAVSAL
jgi:Arc/MetJ-type ribon-helix-helix transcriptional regulator